MKDPKCYDGCTYSYQIHVDRGGNDHYHLFCSNHGFLRRENGDVAQHDIAEGVATLDDGYSAEESFNNLFS